MEGLERLPCKVESKAAHEGDEHATFQFSAHGPNPEHAYRFVDSPCPIVLFSACKRTCKPCKELDAKEELDTKHACESCDWEHFPLPNPRYIDIRDPMFPMYSRKTPEFLKPSKRTGRALMESFSLKRTGMRALRETLRWWPNEAPLHEVLRELVAWVHRPRVPPAPAPPPPPPLPPPPPAAPIAVERAHPIAVEAEEREAREAEVDFETGLAKIFLKHKCLKIFLQDSELKGDILKLHRQYVEAALKGS